MKLIPLFLLLFFSCQEKESNKAKPAEENEQARQLIMKENPDYQLQETYDIIAKSLKSSKNIKSFEKIIKSDLRLLISDEDIDRIIIYVGSKDPYRGGTGDTYKIDKRTFSLTLMFREEYVAEPNEWKVGTL